MNYETTEEIEIAVANHFGWSKKLIVPNVSWGMGIHECDLLISTPSWFLWEIEIKISLSDLKKDLEKRHGHNSNKIKYLYFAIPVKLKPHIHHIPKRAGILIVGNTGHIFHEREPIRNKNARKLTSGEINQLMRLAVMRLWPLKETLLKSRNSWFA